MTEPVNSPVEITVRPMSADVIALVREAARQPEIVDGLIVETDEQARGVAELLRGLKTKATELEERRFAITRPMDEAKSRIMGEFRPALEALADAERRAKAKLLRFQNEAAERQRAAQRQAEAEAEEARQRAAEAEAEAEKLADAGAPVEEVIAALDRAQAASGTAAVAEVSAIVTASAPATTKVSGVATRRTWKVKVDANGEPMIDLRALIAAAAANPDAFAAYLIPNVQALNAFAKSAKGAARVPGVTFEESASIAAPRR